MMIAMSFVFGQIPITDAVMSRYVPDSWRSRILSIKFLLNLCIRGNRPAIKWLYVADRVPDVSSVFCDEPDCLFYLSGGVHIAWLAQDTELIM